MVLRIVCVQKGSEGYRSLRESLGMCDQYIDTSHENQKWDAAFAYDLKMENGYLQCVIRRKLKEAHRLPNKLKVVLRNLSLRCKEAQAKGEHFRGLKLYACCKNSSIL